jgi:hypothetical protein
MKKIIFICLAVLVLSGCATYKFRRGSGEYAAGYVVSRNGDTIPPYTLGKDNSVPQDLSVAKERFARRKNTVERYYKQMGQIESPLKRFWGFPAVLAEFVKGELSLPFVVMRDRRYKRDAEYRAKVDREEEEKDALEAGRMKKLADELNEYIRNDWEKEQAIESTLTAERIGKEPQAAQVAEKAPEARQEPAKKRAEKVARTVIKPKRDLSAKIEALIVAEPASGLSPLRVSFYGSKSYSRTAKITSYSWDFGDGDTSLKANPVNTYYSASYEPRSFIVILTVTDAKGNTASSSEIITVQNK